MPGRAHLPTRAALLIAALVVLALMALPSGARAADTLTVDFETGPAIGTPVNDDYLASAFVRFLAADDGFRPFRRSAPGIAHSGTVAADVGPDVCYADTGDSFGCELVTGGTTGRLTRTASAVSLYAGLFTSNGGFPFSVHLVGYRADGSVAATGADVAMTGSAGINQLTTVTSAAGDIARWALVATGAGAQGATLGFDDLTMTYPTGSLPDISLSASSAVAAVQQGGTTDVPITITRVNGSNGPVALNLSGLPPGVTGTFEPNPVPGTQETATLHLTATANAPPITGFPAQAGFTADPQSNASVAPGQRSFPFLLRVASSFDLQAPAGTNVALPDCATVDTPLVVARDRAFTGTISLSLESLPSGVSGSISPATIAPGGGFNADATVHLSRTATGAALPGSVLVRAHAPGAPDRTIVLDLKRAPASATATSGLGLTPRHLGPGTTIVVKGNGFCQGTKVQVGNSLATVDATVDPDGKTLTFAVPRLGTTGPLTFLPPGGGSPYQSTTPLTVESFRSADGFAFHNFDYGSLSIEELTDLFGADDLFFKINPCWPWDDCTISTGILNPIAAVAWGVINIALHESHGHCFGISRAVEQFLNHKVPYLRFASGVSSPFGLPDATGPQNGLGSYLDSQHAAQTSAEFLRAYLYRDDHIETQLDTLRTELQAGRDPIISIQSGNIGEGHAILAYDEESVPGGTDIYVYDNNRQFNPAAERDPGVHKAQETGASVIHVTDNGHKWSFDIGDGIWSGGDDGSLYVMPQSVIPDDPSLPGLTELVQGISSVFGSAQGAVKTTGASAGAQFLPVLDSHGQPGAAGTWLSKKQNDPLEVTFEGVKDGTYSQEVATPGAVAGVTGVKTARGVRDRVTGNSTGRRAYAALSFDSGTARPLNVQLASRVPAAGASAAKSGAAATTWSATIATHASAHGSEDASLSPGGTMSYGHDGAATTMSFTLASVRTDGGPQTFQSPELRLGAADHLTAAPVGKDLSRVRVAIRHRGGGVTTRVLRSRSRRGIAKVSVVSARVSGGRARVQARVRGLKVRAVLGVSLRLVRGGKTVARHGKAVTKLRNGTQTITWRLPKLARGSYRLITDAQVAAGGLTGSSVRVRRSVPVAIGAHP